MEPYHGDVVYEQGQEQSPAGSQDGEPAQDEHQYDDDSAVRPEEGMAEDESEVDDEEPERPSAPSDSLTPPSPEGVGDVRVHGGQDVHGFEPHGVPDYSGFDVVSLEEEGMPLHDLPHHVGFSDMKGAAKEPRHNLPDAHADDVFMSLHLNDGRPVSLRDNSNGSEIASAVSE